MTCLNPKCTALIFLLLFIPGSILGQKDDIVNDESGAAYRAGLELYAQGQYPQAIRSFQEAYRLDERNVSALFAHGLALVKQKKYKDAAAMFEKVLEKEPSHEKALRMLPVTYANAGDNDGALAAYDRGIKAMPGNYSFYLAKARMLIKLKRLNDAIPLVEKAREIEPGRVEIEETLAQAYAEDGRMDEAFGIASRILAKDAGNVRAHVIAGDYMRLKGNLREAIEHYRIAVKDIETKAYAEHFIEVLEQKIEEKEVEKEYEKKLAETSAKDSVAAPKAAVEPPPPPEKEAAPQEQSPQKGKPRELGRVGITLLVVMVAVVMALVSIHAIMTYRRR